MDSSSIRTHPFTFADTDVVVKLFCISVEFLFLFFFSPGAPGGKVTSDFEGVDYDV